MGFGMEGGGLVESGKERPYKQVRRFIGGEHSGAFGNRLYFLFFETEETIKYWEVRPPEIIVMLGGRTS